MKARVKLALQCRRLIQACLREEERIDADREFYLVIREALERFRPGGGECSSGTPRDGPPAGSSTDALVAEELKDSCDGEREAIIHDGA